MKFLFSLLFFSCFWLKIIGNTVCCNHCCEEGDKQAHISLRHNEPDGIGYSPGYSSVDAFISTNGNISPFIDFRGHIFNNGKYAFNTGIGLRYLFKCSNFILGENIYWDYKESKHTNFHQLSGGLEFLWPCWDIRINGYFPINRHKKRYRTGFFGFRENRAFFFRKYELAMWGGDISLENVLYDSRCFRLYATLGAYYFHGDYGTKATGGLLRAKARISDYLSLEGQVSYDNRFKWIGQGELAINIPFGKRILTRCRSLSNYLAESPERFEMIVTTSHRKKRIARDPNTGLPLFFIFVDNTSSSDGTFESPFPTLAQAQAASKPADVIYVFPGDGTTKGMDAGITLKNSQQFISSAIPLLVSTSFGNFFIPPFTFNRPNVSNLGATAVTLANSNIVSGFNLNAAIGIGGTNIQNTEIKNNVINGTQTINLSNYSGNLVIENNALNNTDAILITTNQISSIRLANNLILNRTTITMNNSTNLTVENNQITSISSTLGTLVMLCQTTGTSTLNIINNQISESSPSSPSFIINSSVNTRAVVSGNNLNRLSSGIGYGIICNGNTLNLKLFGNSFQQATATMGYLFQRTAGVYELQSPDLAITRIQAINTSINGSYLPVGGITFVPFE